MYVQQLRVRNFRSLVDVELTELPPIIVLFGHNGSGKSNILAALDAIFRPKVQLGYVPGAPESLGPFYRGLIADFHHDYYLNTPCQVPFEVTLRTTKEELKDLWPEGSQEDILALPPSTPEDRLRIHLVGRFEPEPGLPQAATIVLESARISAGRDTTVTLFEMASMPDPWLPDSKDKLSLGERERIGETLLNNLTGLFSNIGVARSLQREDFFPSSEPRDEAQPDVSLNFKRRLFKLKHSQLQSDQDKYRRIRDLFHTAAAWGEIDFAQVGNDLDVMTWDQAKLWLPVARRGAGAEQLLVILSEVVLRGASIVGMEELESNLDENHQEKLYRLLNELVSTPGTKVGQVIATVHSFFYGGALPNHQKRYVRLEADGGTAVEPWSLAAYRALFRPPDYYRRQARAARQPSRS